MGRFDLDGMIRRLGDPPAPRLLVDDVHKVWIDDRASLPDLDPNALYHVTHPKAARAIVESGYLKPSSTPRWGASAALNSDGRVFLTDEAGVGRWTHILGQRLFDELDDVPEKLAVLQFRNPHGVPLEQARPRGLYVPGNVAPAKRSLPFYMDEMGARDAGSAAYFLKGAVPVIAPPRVHRTVSKYSVLAPLMGAAAMTGEE